MPALFLLIEREINGCINGCFGGGENGLIRLGKLGIGGGAKIEI
jgi:hypothetical protein